MAMGWESAVGASGTINAVSEVLTQLTGRSDITAEAMDQTRQMIVKAGGVDDLNFAGLTVEITR